MKPPNRIDRQVTAEDREEARGISTATLAEQCLQHLQQGVPYHTTFCHSIPFSNRKAAEKELQQAFELWANTWLAPKLRMIISKHEVQL